MVGRWTWNFLLNRCLFCGHVNFCGGVYTDRPTTLRRCPISCRGSRRPMKPFKWPKVLESYRPQIRERGGCRNYGEDLLRYVYSLFGKCWAWWLKIIYIYCIWYNIQIGIVNKTFSWLGSLTASCFACISTDSISLKIANKDRSLVTSGILCWSCLEGNFANCGSRNWPHTIETRIYAHKCTQGHAITQRHLFLYFGSYYCCCYCRASWIYMWLGIHPAVVRLSKSNVTNINYV